MISLPKAKLGTILDKTYRRKGENFICGNILCIAAMAERSKNSNKKLCIGFSVQQAFAKYLKCPKCCARHSVCGAGEWGWRWGWRGHFKWACQALSLRHSPFHRGHKHSNNWVTSCGVQVAEIKANKVKTGPGLICISYTSQPTRRSELEK